MEGHKTCETVATQQCFAATFAQQRSRPPCEASSSGSAAATSRGAHGVNWLRLTICLISHAWQPLLLLLDSWASLLLLLLLHCCSSGAPAAPQGPCSPVSWLRAISRLNTVL